MGSQTFLIVFHHKKQESKKELILGKIPISSGLFKRKSLVFHIQPQTRPTKNRIRAAIFDILRHRCFVNTDFAQLSFLDAFSGTGAFGFEALSLEASFVQFVEQDSQAQQDLLKNIQRFDALSRCALFNGDLFQFHSSRLFDVIFLDPPYHQGFIGRSLQYLKPVSHENTIWIIECPKQEHFDRNILNLIIRKTYGQICVSFFQEFSLLE